MFITSFEEQNITYRSCSNLRIHLFMSIEGLNLVIENRSTKPVEVNGWMFDSSKCDVDLPKKAFRLPVKGRFITFVGHCPVGSMKWGYLNVGNKTKKFKLI